MSNKEITITNANNQHNFICFKLKGLEDGITVGIVPDPNSHGQALSIVYKGETKIIPFNATTNYINELNEKDTNIISSYIKRYNKDLTKRNGYGIDYCDVFDIEEGCIYSVWCGDPQGLLFLFDKCMIIPSKIVKNDDNFEFEQAVKFWEQNKDKYLNFLTWRDKNLTKWEEDGKIYYGGYQEDYSKFDSIPLYENEKKEDDKITTTLTMDKETYDWITTFSEEDDDLGYDTFLEDMSKLNPEFDEWCPNDCKDNISSYMEKWMEWCKSKNIDPMIEMKEVKEPTGKTFKMKPTYA